MNPHPQAGEQRERWRKYPDGSKVLLECIVVDAGPGAIELNYSDGEEPSIIADYEKVRPVSDAAAEQGQQVHELATKIAAETYRAGEAWLEEREKLYWRIVRAFERAAPSQPVGRERELREVLQDLLNNESCSCVQAHFCARCNLAIQNARAALSATQPEGDK